MILRLIQLGLRIQIQVGQNRPKNKEISWFAEKDVFYRASPEVNICSFFYPQKINNSYSALLATVGGSVDQSGCSVDQLVVQAQVQISARHRRRMIVLYEYECDYNVCNEKDNKINKKEWQFPPNL
jgi:hypothetical protein